MPATIDPVRTDLGYAFRLGCELPDEPMVRGAACLLFDWARLHTPFDEGQPFTQRFWVDDVPVIWPRAGQVLGGLHMGIPMDVSLEGDVVPFRAMFVPPKARQALGLLNAERPITRRADAVLQAEPHGWSRLVGDFLRSQPELQLVFSRAVGDGEGWWKIEAR